MWCCCCLRVTGWEWQSKYLTGALANARNRLEQSLAREAQLRDVVKQLEQRVRLLSSGDGSASSAASFSTSSRTPHRMQMIGAATASAGSAAMPSGQQAPAQPLTTEQREKALGSRANKVLWELNHKLVRSLCDMGKAGVGNISWSLKRMESQQVAEVRLCGWLSCHDQQQRGGAVSCCLAVCRCDFSTSCHHGLPCHSSSSIIWKRRA